MIRTWLVFYFLFLCSSALASERAVTPQESKKLPILKIAALRVMPERWDKEANLKKLEKYAREAASQGANLVITGEDFLGGYVGNNKILEQGSITREQYLKFCEPIDGPSLRRVSRLAKGLGIYIVLGFPERRGDSCFNSVVVFGPDGQLVHRYSKSHIKGERFHTEGTDFGVFDTRFGKMGSLICYDRQLPEPARILAVRGAQLLLISSYGAYGEMNDAMMRTRAKENGVYLAFAHPKRALIIDPEGDIIARDRRSFGGDNLYGNGDQIVFAEIRLSDTDGGTIPMRRPQYYDPLLKK